MRKLLFILIIFSAGCKAQQPCVQNINGVNVPCTQDFLEQRSLDSIAKAKSDAILLADSVDANNSFTPILSAFQPMVGKSLSQLTATQKTNMVEAIMWKLGIINRQRQIRALDKWLFKQ